MKWNKLSDGKPNKSGYYLVSANDIVNAWTCELYFDVEHDEFKELSGFVFEPIIDAWSEMPEPYNNLTHQTR